MQRSYTFASHGDRPAGCLWDFPWQTKSLGPGWLVVNGNHHSQNNFVLDGFDNNQGTTNLQSRSAQVTTFLPVW